MTSGDASRLYDDVLVAIDASRGINNGQPSLHAHSIDALRVREGETVVQIGAGAGYYSAILAQLVGPAGRVVAYEIEPDIAQRAKATSPDFPRSRSAPVPASRTCPTPTRSMSTPPPPIRCLAWLEAFREAAGRRVFWVLFGTFFVCGLSTNGLIQTHWITLCGDYGIAPVSAAGMLAAIGLFDFVGTLLSGWLADRYDNRWLLFFYYGLRGLSLLYLPYTEFSVVSLSLFAVFYGLDWVATVPPTVRLSVDGFGPERANVTFGWISRPTSSGRPAPPLGQAWRAPISPAICRRCTSPAPRASSRRRWS